MSILLDNLWNIHTFLELTLDLKKAYGSWYNFLEQRLHHS